MKLFGQHDPAGGDGYVPGAWDEVVAAYLDGHISEEAYDLLQKPMDALREATSGE